METDAPIRAHRERTDLLQTLAKHRGFLRQTVRDLSDEQAAHHSTVSALCLGGLIKHVADVESSWVDFILDGPAAMASGGDWSAESSAGGWEARFQMSP